MEDNLLHSKSTSLNIISSKNTMTEIYRIRFNQVFGHHCPVKLTNKINLHTLVQTVEGVLCGINFLNHMLLVLLQILPANLPRIPFSQIHKMIHFLSIFIYPYVALFFFFLLYGLTLLFVFVFVCLFCFCLFVFALLLSGFYSIAVLVLLKFATFAHHLFPTTIERRFLCFPLNIQGDWPYSTLNVLTL